jgi:hypothetical protein
VTTKPTVCVRAPLGHGANEVARTWTTGNCQRRRIWSSTCLRITQSWKPCDDRCLTLSDCSSVHTRRNWLDISRCQHATYWNHFGIWFRKGLWNIAIPELSAFAKRLKPSNERESSCS